MSESVRNIRANVYLNDKKAGKSLRNLESDARKLNNQLRHMDTNSKEYNETMAKLQGKRRLIREHKKEIYGIDRGWSNMANKVNKYFGLVTAGLAAVAGVAMTVKNQIAGAGRLSDLRADVAKTTQLSLQEIERLESRYKTFNTRTPRAELHKLAAEAGKMGVKGVDAIAKVVEETNELNVALGDDLGEGAALKISKLADVFDTSMRHIGSGINAVSDNSKAAAGYLTDFMFRMAGTSKEFNLAEGDALGYAASLDELGLKVEMSTTALNGFYTDFIKDTEKFGEVAGFAKGELSKLVGEKGANEGMLAFLEKMRETHTESADFIKAMEAVGITGDRGSQVFLALSQNVDKIKQNQKLANEEIEKGTSLTEEYARKNENLQAGIEKVQRWLYRAFVSGPIVNGLTKVVGLISDWVETPLSESIRESRIEMNALFTVMKDANVPLDQRKELMNRINTEFKEYLPYLIEEESSLIDVEKAQKAANQAMRERIVLLAARELQEEVKEDLLQAERRVLEKQLELEEVRQKAAEGQTTWDPDYIAEQLEHEKEELEKAQKAYDNFQGSRVAKLIQQADRIAAEKERVKKEVQEYRDFLEEYEARQNNDDNDEPNEGEEEKARRAKEWADERKKAEEEIQQFINGLHETELEKAKSKFEKLLALAEKYGIDRQELEVATDAELRRIKYENLEKEALAEQERKLHLMENSMQQLWEYEQGKLIETAEFRALTKEEQQARLLELELQHLQRVLEARQSLGEETFAIEKKITELKAQQTDSRIKLNEQEEQSLRRSAAASAFNAAANARSAEDAKNAVLNSIRAQIQGYLAKAIAGALANELATKGLVGVITGAAVAGTAGVLFNSLIPSFHIGGPTGTGLGIPDPKVPGRKIKGYVHDNEYVVATEELRNPNTAPLVAMIEAQRQRRMGGGSFESGGFSSGGQSQVINNSTTQTIDVSDLVITTKELTKTLMEIQQRGILAVADDDFQRKMQEKQDTDDFIIENSRL